MINCNTPTLLIDPSECIGDSLGKINYNTINLDASISNLSAALIDNNFYNVLSAFVKSTNSVNGDLTTGYVALTNIVTENYVNQFKIAATTVNILSSYWGNYEFSISMPINAISLTQNDVSLLVPVLSSPNFNSINSLVDASLKINAEVELNTNYSPLNYPENTVVNVSFFIYNIFPLVNNTGEPDPLISARYFPTNTFSFNQREIDVQYNRDSVYLSTGVILRYYASDSKWNYIGFLYDENNATAIPNQTVQAIFQKAQENKNTISVNNNQQYIQNCETINVNTWYPTEQYVYSNGVYTGASTKLGTLTLTFRTPDNQTSVFKYTASGYDANSNNGGSDVYLEYSGNVINAYLQYPGPKTLVQTWPYPYLGKKGVNFRYTIDNKGVAFSACASKSLS